MKTMTFFARISLMMCVIGALSACDKPVGPTGPDELGTPEGLNIGTLTETTARLSWTAVASAEKYNVVIGDAAVVVVTDATYTATGLTPETAYTWKVQAVKGDTVSDWGTGPAFTTPKGAPVFPAPADLAATVTHHTAQLSWTHAGADSHELVFNDTDPVTLTGTEYLLINLTPETTYAWKVRSGKDDLWSDWVEGEFSTAAIPAPINVGFINARTRYDGNAYMEGTSCIDITFTDHEYYSDDRSGWLLELDLIIDAVADGPEVEFIDITPGTYPFSATKGPNIVYLSQYTIVREVLKDGYYVQPMPTITEGTVTFSKNGTDYTMTVSLKVDDGRTINGSYNGPIEVKNPKYDPEAKKGMKFGKAELVEYGGGSIKNYFIRLWDEDATATGTGYVLALDLYAPGDRSIIPDGLYTLGGSAAFQMDMVYSYLKTYKDGYEDDQDSLTSGTVNVTRTGDGTYTIVVDMLVATGLEIKATYSGAVTTVPR